MRKIDALEAWKCFGATCAIEVIPNDLRDLNGLIRFGRSVNAVVRVQPDNQEIIFLQKAGAGRSRQRAFRLTELKEITFKDL